MIDSRPGRVVDQSAVRINQAFIISLLVLSFIGNSHYIATFVSVVMLIGTAVPSLSLFKGIYRRLLLPLGLVKADIKPDNPEPHRFAQGFGGVVVAFGVVSLFLGVPLLGWILVWLVIFLASLNVFLGFCAGCFLYYQLNRLNVPGFEHSPIR